MVETKKSVPRTTLHGYLGSRRIEYTIVPRDGTQYRCKIDTQGPGSVGVIFNYQGDVKFEVEVSLNSYRIKCLLLYKFYIVMMKVSLVRVPI